jgi:hypothetical protein
MGSATGRSDVRHADDHYETPAHVVGALIQALPQRALSGRCILDPCCGNGAILKALQPAPFGHLLGVEQHVGRAELARREGFTVDVADFLTTYAVLGDRVDRPPDVVVMNPPYRHALDFVVCAMAAVREHRGWMVCALLRLGFLASKKRRDWWQRNPADVFVLSSRPSFTGDGKTDASDYAWFVWGDGPRGKVVIL